MLLRIPVQMQKLVQEMRNSICSSCRSYQEFACIYCNEIRV